MPLVRCASMCGRVVSVSLAAPNPVALQAGYETKYLRCPRCAQFWCSACQANCSCGVELEGPRPEHALAIVFGAPTPRLVARVVVTKGDA